MIGCEYYKVLYCEYIDKIFSKEKDYLEYFGFLGFIFKGEEGDMIVVYFKNMVYGNFLVYLYGVFYRKDLEGVLYVDEISGVSKKDDYVGYGESYVYIWIFIKSYVLILDDDDCFMWIYYLYLLLYKDINIGLLGNYI